jgi:hypothetical protein
VLDPAAARRRAHARPQSAGQLPALRAGRTRAAAGAGAFGRIAANPDIECDKQWELPFAVATSAGSEGDDRVAWWRTLQVDERLTVIAVAEGSPLQVGERIVRISRVQERSALRMLEVLGVAREDGRPFEVQTADGRVHRIQPFEVCRGYTRLAPPTAPKTQDYHWLMSVHPLELPQAGPSADEALWAVLWTQGLSEEGGARMKAYQVTTQIGGTLLQLYSLATGVAAVRAATSTILEEAAKKAGAALAEALKDQILQQGQELARQKIREALQGAVEKVGKSQALGMMQKAAANRGALGGVAWIASTVWERADAWAFARMRELGADPIAGLRLHQKLQKLELAGNAFALDLDRLLALNKVAEAAGMRAQALVALGGLPPEELGEEMQRMPQASVRTAFRFDSPDDPAALSGGRGLIDNMLHLPLASGGR